jgi:sugar phosphate isomerase/epimerase
MRLGISSYTYGWAIGHDAARPPNAPSARTLIRRAADLGVRVVQLCENLPASTYEDDSLEAVTTAAKEQGVSIEVGTHGIGAAHLRRFAAVARRLESPILRVVIDTADDHPTPAQVVRRLGEVLGDFQNAGVTLAIENHDRFAAAVLAGIVREFASPHVGVCLDTANSFGALEGPATVLETLGPYVMNLHLKDVAAKRFSHLQGFVIEGRPAGQGMIDIPWILGRLKEFGRDPNAIAELWTPPEATVEQTIEKEARWAVESVRALRRWIKE